MALSAAASPWSAEANVLRLTPPEAEDRTMVLALSDQLHRANGYTLTAREHEWELERALRMGGLIGMARKGRMTVGYALWRVQRRRVYVRHFVVRRDMQGRGLGRAFFGLLLDILPGHLPVDLHSPLPESRAFWFRLGFQPRPLGGLRYARNEESAG